MEKTPPPGPTGSGPGSPGVGDGEGSGEGLGDGLGEGDTLGDGVGLGDGLGLSDGLGLGSGDGNGVWPSSAPTLRSRSETRHSNARCAVSPSEERIKTTPTMTSVFDRCLRRCLPLKRSLPESPYGQRRSTANSLHEGGRRCADALCKLPSEHTRLNGVARASVLGIRP
jgi:hypothetical protein